MFSKDGIATEAGIQTAIANFKAMGAIKPDQQLNASAFYTTDFGNNVK